MAARLQVLVLTTSYPTPETPVAGMFVREHALAAARHCDVRVVHLERAQTHRFHVTRVDDVLETWRVAFPRRPNTVSAACLLPAAVVGVRAATRDGFEPDLLHAHFFLAGFPAIMLGRRRGIPVVVSEHWSVFLPDDPASLPPVLRWGAKRTLERADLVLPVSEALARGIRDSGIEAHMRVVPNAVDEATFYPSAPRGPANPPRLLCVALLYEAKGVDLLLEAVAILQRNGRSLRLDVVGDGELRGDYERRARSLGLDDAVIFHGVLTKPEVAEKMRQADLYVLPSRFDNNPVALIEALATGLPVVATSVGGVPEIVGDDGLLTEPEPERIATAIAEALDRLAAFDRTAISKHALVRYGSETIGDELSDIYESVARR